MTNRNGGRTEKDAGAGGRRKGRWLWIALPAGLVLAKIDGEPKPIFPERERFGWFNKIAEGKIETPALTAPAIEQSYYEVDRRSKAEVLTRLIDLNDFTYGLIFCGTKMMADELTEQLLARGYAADKHPP